MRRIVRGILVFGTGAIGLGGCGQWNQPEKVLGPDAFTSQPPLAREDQNANPIDQPGRLMYDDVTLRFMQNGDHIPPPQKGISPTVREAVKPPNQAVVSELPATGPRTGPATLPAVDVSGQYQVVGSVLAEVNGTPIYADKVLNVLDRALQAEARKYDEGRFRNVAADLIQRQVWEFIHAELEYAAAERNLEAKDKDLARAETIVWRQQQIAKAGGSLEMAKRKAVEDGTDFEEQVRQHFRLTMTQLYYQRRVFPQIRVSPGDMRGYYDDNLQKEFTQHPEAKFRVIRIDAEANNGTREAALDKARRLKERAAHGEDFADLATKVNDDANLRALGGYPVTGGWVDRGAYALDKVEKAVWALQPNGVTDPIDMGDAFYVAKLEDVKRGKVDSFEAEAVQDKIREELRREQFNALREKVRLELEKKAVIRNNPDMVGIALEMVMQKYSRWVAMAAKS